MANDNEVVEAIAQAVREDIAWNEESMFTDVETGDHHIVLFIGENLKYIMSIRQVVRG